MKTVLFAILVLAASQVSAGGFVSQANVALQQESNRVAREMLFQSIRNGQRQNETLRKQRQQFLDEQRHRQLNLGYQPKGRRLLSEK